MSKPLFLTLVVDCSGSMRRIAAEMNDTIAKALVAVQVADPNRSVIVDVWCFDTTVTHTIAGGSIGQVPHDLVKPGGMTALNDAVGGALSNLAARVVDEQVRVLVITDGLENSSTDFTTEQIKDLVETYTARGWEIAYLGADVDAAAEGASRGVDPTRTRSFNATPAGVSAMGQSMSTYMTTGAFGEPAIDYTADESVEVPAANGSVEIFDGTGRLISRITHGAVRFDPDALSPIAPRNAR